MEELNAKYERLTAEYDKTVDDAIKAKDASQLPKIKELNTQVSKTLNDMLEKLTFMKKESPNLKVERDKLVQKLGKIQSDYSELVAKTDTLETLRRIRQQESGDGNRQLYWYLIAFLIVALLLLLYLMFYGKREATATIASAVPMTPALT
jgi:hypothetical protein